MKATYDPEARAIYVYVNDKPGLDRVVYFTAAISGGHIDYNEAGEVLGYEFINVDLETV